MVIDLVMLRHTISNPFPATGFSLYALEKSKHHEGAKYEISNMEKANEKYYLNRKVANYIIFKLYIHLSKMKVSICKSNLEIELVRSCNNLCFFFLFLVKS